MNSFHPGERQGRIQACARDGRGQGRIALPRRYPLTVAVDRRPWPLTVDRGGDAGSGCASGQARAMRGLQRGRLAGREPLALPGGADTTAAVERRISASFRAATAGQRSTAPVPECPPSNRGRHGSAPTPEGWWLSSFIFPKGGRTHGTASPRIHSAKTSRRSCGEYFMEA